MTDNQQWYCHPETNTLSNQDQSAEPGWIKISAETARILRDSTKRIRAELMRVFMYAATGEDHLAYLAVYSEDEGDA